MSLVLLLKIRQQAGNPTRQMEPFVEFFGFIPRIHLDPPEGWSETWEVIGRSFDSFQIAFSPQYTLIQYTQHGCCYVVPHRQLLRCTYQMRTSWGVFFNRLLLFFFFYYFYKSRFQTDGKNGIDNMTTNKYLVQSMQVLLSATLKRTNQICYRLFNHVAAAQGSLSVLEASRG